MDNMLYIIAGLVLILLVAGLVWRKNKAQKPSVPPHVTSEQNATTTKTNYDTPAPSSTDSNKFDHITITQRFMDQQRYDKAIETLNRGLNEKPNDSQLSLKLLSVYATIDQPENFNTVYETIKAHNDFATIARAEELKGLYFEEKTPVVAEQTPAEDNSNFDSIDFDLAPPPVDNSPTQSASAFAESSSHTLVTESVDIPAFSDEFYEADATTKQVENNDAEDDFDLTLSDLESNLENDLESNVDEPIASITNPVTSADAIDDKSTAVSTIETTAASEDNDISDFDFDFNFDIPEEDSAPTEPSIASKTANSAAETEALDDDAFTLDFDDLTTDADDNTQTTMVENMTVDAAQNNEDDFTLSLDGFDESDSSNSTETALASENTVLENTVLENTTLKTGNDIDHFVLEDSNFKDNSLEGNSFEDNSLEDNSLEDNSLEDGHFEETIDSDDLESPVTAASSITPTAPLLFDDNTLLDDDFEADSSVTTTPEAPVEIETDIAPEADIETAENFSARFSADFDFVKSLDSNQVTLDLADQYLQLGEYDSAKRLLNEVMTQGNSEQQKQARLLLGRAA